MRCKNEVLGVAFLSDIKDIMVVFGQFFTVAFGLDPFSVILVPEAEPRNRHGNPGRKEACLFDLDVRVKPEHDHKIGGVIW